MRRYLLLIVALCMIGCATAGTRISKEGIGKIKEGETTKQQVIEILGSPRISSLTSDGKEVFTYHFTSVKSSPQNFIPIIGLIQSRMDMDTQMTHVLFTKDGIVEKVTSTSSQSEMKYGIVTD